MQKPNSSPLVKHRNNIPVSSTTMTEAHYWSSLNMHVTFDPYWLEERHEYVGERCFNRLSKQLSILSFCPTLKKAFLHNSGWVQWVQSSDCRRPAHNGKERPTSIPISRMVAAHDTPYTDPFSVCVRVYAWLHKINVSRWAGVVYYAIVDG